MWLKHTQFPGLACLQVPGPNLHFTCWSKHKLWVKRELLSPSDKLILEMVTCVTSVVYDSRSCILLTCGVGPGHECSVAFPFIRCPHHNTHGSWSQSWPWVNTLS